MDSIGVNVHLAYTDTAYTHSDRVVAALRELGVRHVRDGLLVERPDQYAAINTLAAAGIRSTLIMGDPQGRFGTGSLEELLTTLETEVVGAVDAVEGPNEYDVSGDPDWASALRRYQEQLYRGVDENPRLDHLSVLGPSLVESESWGELGELSRFLDYGNIHPYPGGESPEGSLDQAFGLAHTTSGEKPVVATETGYHNALSAISGQPPVSEEAAAAYMPRVFLEYFARGIPRTFAYELIDEKPNLEATDPEQHFGLLRNDFSEKPAFATLRNLIDLTGDSAETCPVTPLPLDVDPSTTNVHGLLLDKCEGTYVLVLWQPVPVWDTAERRGLSPPVRPVTVRLEDSVAEARVYRPAESQQRVSHLERPAVLELEVPADPLVIELVVR